MAGREAVLPHTSLAAHGSSPPQAQAADGHQQTPANQGRQTLGTNQMSGNEVAALEEYYHMKLHHFSKNDGLQMVL